MYAVVKVGGKQYRVKEGDEFKVERLAVKGKKITLHEVLLVADDGNIEIGKPFLPRAKIICEVLGEKKGKKVMVFKYRRRKNYRKKIGHRQLLTHLRVKEISVGKTEKEGEE
ncbi:MAG: 50S ribosomal protein L21 [Candidatus Omnitrophica bacterium]|nr:50S ribosomal protein L21 [Candidatus Omnitrophota bacterium]MCM8798133.1 50S ribosomal protein L21 [Candidatus Omnitrophota bacterium]